MGTRRESEQGSDTAATAPAGSTAAELGAMDAVAGDAGEAVGQAYAAENEGTGTERSGSAGSVSGSGDPPARAEPLDETAATTSPAGEQAADLGSPEAVAGDPDEAVEEAAEKQQNP
jgi:hypothetical protein